MIVEMKAKSKAILVRLSPQADIAAYRYKVEHGLHSKAEAINEILEELGSE